MSYLEPGNSAILAGLALRAHAGELRLTQELRPIPAPLDSGPWHLRNKAESGLRLVLDDRVSAYVDVHDSWEIDTPEYEANDLYFKRSLDLQRFPVHLHPKLRPLGLLNDVRLDGIDIWEARRILAQALPVHQRVAALLRHMAEVAAATVNLGPRPNLRLLNAPPDVTQPPRVLFMAGLWDPSCIPEDSSAKTAEFVAINETRASCVRQLRREFGSHFYGGVQHSAFARNHYPDVLLPQSGASSKRAYIRRVRDFPICIATTGLHGSNGWKLAEYVGLSRSIVSEPPHYEVPGGFKAASHYLEFHSPETCVEQAARLMEDHDLRIAQMQANHAYHASWMHPHVLTGRILDSMAGAHSG